MRDKLLESCELALGSGVVVLGGVATGVLTIMFMSHVMDMSLPGKLMAFICAVMTYMFSCAIQRW